MDFKQFIKEGVLDDISKDIENIGSNKELDSDIKTDKNKLVTPEKYKFKYNIEDLKNYSQVKGIETDINKSIAYGDMIRNPEYFKKNKRKKIKLVYMTPREYLEETAKGFEIPYETNLKNIEVELAREYAEKMIEGDVFPTPYIDYTTVMFLQEGRHRAYAAMLLGKKKIPVLIIEKV